MTKIPQPKYDYDVAKLVRAYQIAVDDIMSELLRTDINGLSKDLAAKQLAEISGQLSALNDESAEWVKKYIPKAARNGAATAILALGTVKTMEEALKLTRFGSLNERMVKSIIADTQQDLLAVTQNIDRRVRNAVRSASATVLQRNMAAGINGHQTNKREILADLQKNLGSALQTGIIDASGRRWKPETYVDMLVRTKMMQAHNEATRNEALERGVMYATISRHGAKDACRNYEGKVVKLDSSAPGSFPTLDSLRGSKQIFHPNCKHVIVPIRNPEGIFDELTEEHPTNSSTFVPARTIKEANAWAKKNLPIDTVDYKGYDIRLANETNQQLGKLLSRYPEVSNTVRFVGTTQERNSRYVKQKIEQVYQKYRTEHPNVAETRLREIISRKVARPAAVPSTVYAKAANGSWGLMAGITFNAAWARHYEKIAESTAKDVAAAWHPIGTESPMSILTHEFGHSLDYFLDEIGLRDQYVTPIVDEVLRKPKVNVGENLSHYAVSNIKREINSREIVAEAFAEYMHSDSPRDISQRIGEAIEQALAAHRKGNIK